jgi:hypothetical protein
MWHRTRRVLYAFRISVDCLSPTTIAEWITLERKCCPFLEFELRFEADRGPVCVPGEAGKVTIVDVGAIKSSYRSRGFFLVHLCHPL